MRIRSEGSVVSVHAIAGTYVVLLGLDVKPEACAGLLGFTISRETAGEGKKKFLGGSRYFAALKDRAEKSGSDIAPIQAFLWGDYEAQPGTTYTYRVVPQYGKPGKLQPGEDVAVTISTEKREGATHSIYFNRGVAGSKAFSRRFGDHRRHYLVESNGKIAPQLLIKPEEIPEREGYIWLSRGLEEAMLEFIAQAKGPEYSIRSAVYEFTYLPAIQAFVDALERGVDVKIVHHAKRENVFRFHLQKNPKDGTADWTVDTVTTWTSGKPGPKTYKNRYLEQEKIMDEVCHGASLAVARIGLKNSANVKAFGEMLIDRTITTISHNKFIVLLKNGKPIEVWTGSTNFTAGGIFGQSNVGHVIRDPAIAAKYLAYWKKLAEDPPKTEMTEWVAKNTPDLDKAPPKNSITPIFSPRPTRAMLDWYAERIADAKNAVFFTAAFSVDDCFMKQFAKSKNVAPGEAYQRYIILESRTGLMKDKAKALEATEQNHLAWGAVMKVRKGHEDDPLMEALTGLNQNVQFLHTKYLLIDPLSDDPLVATGSANFSKNSTTDNDENLVIIRGDTRVADIFLGEFMRLFNHFANRNKLNSLSEEAYIKSEHLAENDSWAAPYFKDGTPEQQERILFR